MFQNEVHNSHPMQESDGGILMWGEAVFNFQAGWRTRRHYQPLSPNVMVTFFLAFAYVCMRG